MEVVIQGQVKLHAQVHGVGPLWRSLVLPESGTLIRAPPLLLQVEKQQELQEDKRCHWGHPGEKQGKEEGGHDARPGDRSGAGASAGNQG